MINHWICFLHVGHKYLIVNLKKVVVRMLWKKHYSIYLGSDPTKNFMSPPLIVTLSNCMKMIYSITK
jgi:hypothetical protein